jgi:membrane-bound lytic murein transglycosylase B
MSFRINMIKKLFGIILLGILSFQPPSYSQEEKSFKIWLDELKAEAGSRGFSRESINSAFSEIREPVKSIVAKDRNQPEVVESYADYINRRVTSWRKINGKRLIKKHEVLLKKIAHEYGVHPRFIVAIWGMETNYGTVPLKEPVFSALATLAYDKRRGDYFRAQFFAALTILDKGFAPYEKMKSSWAGAMGQCQFMPDNYIKYAVDYDKDGKRDIWNTEADVFASIANYLSSSGWEDNQTWGRPVILPDVSEEVLFAKNPNDLPPVEQCERYEDLKVWRDLQGWQALGVRRLSTADLPVRSIPATLITGDPGDKKGYIIYRDFCAIMRFNPAFKYAISIGLLADHLRE